MNDKNFSKLSLNKELLSSLAEFGYAQMTDVQEKCLPHILNHHDVIAQAKTGSGKTAAFTLGLLSHTHFNINKIQGLVLCPTRELADQVSKEIRKLAKFIPDAKIITLCGGKPLREQRLAMERGAHIIVGTPGRIKDHLERKTLDLTALKILVLDEADRMLDMGFFEIISEIIETLPQVRQTLLFSATYPDSIKEMSSKIQKKPIEIKVESHHNSEDIKQFCYQITHEKERLNALKNLLRHHKPKAAIVFCNTKEQCHLVFRELQELGLKVLELHGDLEQRDREEVLVLFSNKSFSVLVATDVASRGLHIEDIDIVVNYHLPRNAETYVHRVGRTGRAGKKGQALSLFTTSEKFKLTDIATYQKTPIVIENLPAIGKQSDIKDKTSMTTLKIAGGRKNKVSKGDILGALTRNGSGVLGHHVGKIDVFDFYSYVALDTEFSVKALNVLENGPIKGRSFKIKILSSAN